MGGAKCESSYELRLAMGEHGGKIICCLDVIAGHLPLLWGTKRWGLSAISVGFSLKGVPWVYVCGSPVEEVSNSHGTILCRIGEMVKCDERLSSNAVLSTIPDTQLTEITEIEDVRPAVATVQETVEETKTGGKEKVVEKVVSKPIYDLDFVSKVHKLTHSGPSRMYAFLKSCQSPGSLSDTELHNLKKTCKTAYEACAACAKFGTKTTPAAAMRLPVGKNFRCWCDVFTIDSASSMLALVVVDEGTRDVGAAILESEKTEDVFRAYMESWGFIHGVHQYMVTDGGGCFGGDNFKNLCADFGITKLSGPAYSSQSFGIPERVIGTFRPSLDRIREDPAGPRTKKDYRFALGMICNGIRNELLVGGTCASERSIGSRSSVFRNFLSDGPTLPERRSTLELMRIKDVSTKVFHSVINDKALQAAMNSKATRQQKNALISDYALGDHVEFLREPKEGRGATWHSGVLCGILPHENKTTVNYFHVDWGGRMLRILGRHVRKKDASHSQFGLLDEVPELAEDNGEPAVLLSTADGSAVRGRGTATAKRKALNAKSTYIYDDAAPNISRIDGSLLHPHACNHGTASEPCDSDNDVMPLPALVCDDDDEPLRDIVNSDDEDDVHPDTLLADAYKHACKSEAEQEPQFWGGLDLTNENKKKLILTCFGLEVENGGDEIILLTKDDRVGGVKAASSMDAYGHSFNELSPEEQHASRQKGIDDYDEHDAWDKEGITDEELRLKMRYNKKIVALRAGWVDKAKIIAGILKGKSRLTPKGFEDKLRNIDDNMSPTVDSCTLKVLEVLGLREGWEGYSLDFSQAFFQSSEELERPIYIRVPDEFTENGRVWKRLRKSVPGTNHAPRAWYNSICKWLLAEGFKRSRLDPALFLYPSNGGGDTVWSGYIPLHVDDVKGRGTPEFIKWFRTRIDKDFGGRWKIGEFINIKVGQPTDFCGKENTDVKMGMTMNQDKYVEKKLVLTELDLEGDSLESSYRKSLGTAMWASTNSQFQEAYSVALAAQKTSTLTKADAVLLNHSIRRMQESPLTTMVPCLDRKYGVKIVGIVDAGMSDGSTWCGGQQGRLVGLCEDRGEENVSGDKILFGVVEVKSGKLRRVASGSFAAECIAAHSCLGSILKVRGVVEEFLRGIKQTYGERMWCEQCAPDEVEELVPVEPIKLEVLTDSNGLVTNCHGEFNRANIEGRRAEDLTDFRECIQYDSLTLRHIDGVTNPADALTKSHNRCTKTKTILRNLLETGWLTVDLSDAYTGNKIAKHPSLKKKKKQT